LRKAYKLRVFDQYLSARGGGRGAVVKEAWRTVHNKELHYLYFSTNIPTIKPRRNRLVERVGESRGAYVVLEGKLRERDHLESVGFYRMIILK
jgi:hypothetical protein